MMQSSAQAAGSLLTSDDSSVSPTGGLFFSILEGDCHRYPSLGVSVPVHFLQRKWQGQHGRVLTDAESMQTLTEVFDLCQSVPSFNLGLQKWLEVRERVQSTMMQIHNDTNAQVQELKMMTLIATSPGSFFLMRWFMDQRVLRHCVAHFLTKVDSRFEHPVFSEKTTLVFERVLFGSTTPGGFFEDNGVVCPAPMVAGLLIILANAELSGGKTNEAVVRIACAMELLEACSGTEFDGSPHTIHMIAMLQVKVLMILSRAGAFLLDKRIQQVAGAKAFEIYLGIQKKTEDAQFIRLPTAKRKPAREASDAAAVATEEAAVASGLASRYGDSGLHRYVLDVNRLVMNATADEDKPAQKKPSASDKSLMPSDASNKPKSSSQSMDKIPHLSVGGNASALMVRSQFLYNQQLKKLDKLQASIWNSVLWVRLLIERGVHYETVVGDKRMALHYWLKAMDVCCEQTSAKDTDLFDVREVTLQLRLNYVLHTPKVVELFKLFCVQTYCDENIDCWRKIEQFSALDAMEQAKLKELALDIWSEFIAESAERPVNITADVRKFLKERIFGEKLLNPYVFQEAQRSLENLMSGEILKHFFTSNLFKVNVSKQEMTDGMADIFLKSKSKIHEVSFGDEDVDFVFSKAVNSRKDLESGPEKNLMLMMRKMGKNIFAATVAAHALTLLQEMGVFGAPEAVTFANRLLSCSLNLGPLMYMCSVIVPHVAELIRCEPRLQRKIYEHACSFFAAFNNVGKVELCGFILEEILLLRGRQKSGDMDRSLVLNRVTGTGFQVRMAALLFDAALPLLVRKPAVAQQRLTVSFGILMDVLCGRPVSALTSKAVSRVPSLVDGLPKKVRAESVYEDGPRAAEQRVASLLRRSDSLFEKEGQMSVAFAELFLLHLRLLIALNATELPSLITACGSVNMPPYDHLIALELAKYYDFIEDLDKAHDSYVRCISKCKIAPLNQETADAMSYSLFRVGQLRRDSDMLKGCYEFVKQCGFADRLNLMPKCQPPEKEELV